MIRISSEHITVASVLLKLHAKLCLQGAGHRMDECKNEKKLFNNKLTAEQIFSNINMTKQLKTNLYSLTMQIH
jgi:hypothetical protein